ncbi:GNAT family N-acetyltransferase [Nocardioides gilvus]|uniref:GNAT family N-acetyltransferase n=1 Tax=Nocardioides gilvus TaxID=1735589 RepID=UPI001EF4AE93|nr:GNAT family N-acetyltransferase [Nocardioides gilvus]
MSALRLVGPTDLSDLADLALLEQSLFGAEAWSAQALAELASTPGRRLLVTESEEPDRAVVGYALTGVQGDFAELLRIGVAARLQRSGIASTLLDAALRGARESGADRMLLEVSVANAAALAFYSRCGFVEIDRRGHYYRDGSDALVLQRDLPPLDSDPSGSGRMEP